MEVVDTTGAGNTHNGALPHGYLRGWGIEKAGVSAAAAAVWAVTRKRAQTGAVSEWTVLEFLERLQRGDE